MFSMLRLSFGKIGDRGIPEHASVDSEIGVGQEIPHFISGASFEVVEQRRIKFDCPISSFSDILNAFGDSISASSVGHKLLLRHTADVLSRMLRAFYNVA